VKISDSDILLPPKNQGDSLAREVTKGRVRYPSDGKERDPTDGYIQQLRSLAGMTNPNPLTY
jgi:hypothetical protein